MSLNPFTADPVIAQRIAKLSATHGNALRAKIGMALGKQKHRPGENLGGVLLKAEADALIARHDLAGVEDLMLLALDEAKKLASPPISAFFVGSVGLEAETGNLIFGGNVEFVGTHLGTTLHGEGFVFTRAFSRGTTVEKIAIGEAHPCAHCRQYLSEYAATRDLLLIDPLGHRLTMNQLYPWPFDPDYLGEPGIVAGAVPWPALALRRDDLDTAVAKPLLAALRRSHAPYSKCPAAMVLQLQDGQSVSGSAIESVAFNPSIPPLQGAIIELLAHGYRYGDIVGAHLATKVDGAVDYASSSAELLARIAPGVALTVSDWG